MRRRRRDSELFKLVQEILQALQWVKPWKGKVAVTIQLLGGSISDEDISKYLKSKGKIKPVWMKSKSHKHQLSVMACRASL